MADNKKSRKSEDNLGDFIGRLVYIYGTWNRDEFLNKSASLYVEAIFHYTCQKIDRGEITVEQEKFLVKCLQEAQNYKIPTRIYDCAPDYQWQDLKNNQISS